MRKTLLLPFLFFFIVLTIPVFAYYDFDVNTTFAADQPLSIRGMDCTNNSGTLYCYVATQCNGGDWCVERYNATWQDKKECVWNALGYIGDNFAMINSTHAMLHNDPPQNDYFLVNVTDIATNSTCPYTLIESDFNFTEDYYQAGTYYPVDYTDSELYFAKQDIIVNGTTGQDIRSGWGITELESVSFPDETDNNTAYGKSVDVGGDLDASDIYKVTNGLSYQTLNNVFEIYGMEEATTSQFLALDWYKVDAATTYIFIAYNGTVYRGNWSEYESAGAVSYITPTSPINGASALTNPPVLTAALFATTNGTVMWYVDGGWLGNTSVTSSASEQSVHFTPSAVLTAEAHNWTATFVDGFGNSWTSDTEDFYIGQANFWVQPMDYFAQLTGNFFGAGDLNTAREISSIFFSFIFALILPIILIVKGIKTDGNSMMYLFIMIFMAFLVMFTLLGWFPTWILIVLVIIASIGFIKLGGIGG